MTSKNMTEKKNINKKLSTEDLAQFTLSTLLNIDDLILESKILFNLFHFARSYYLAYFAFEESAKLNLYLFLNFDLFINKSISIKDFENIIKDSIFKNHKMKLRMAFLNYPGYDFQKTVSTINFLIELKDRSLYSDLFLESICIPRQFIGREQSSSLLEISETTFRKKLKEFGVKKISELDNEMIIQHYDHLWKEVNQRNIFTSLMKNKSNDYVSYYQFLYKIIKNEKLYNSLKRSFTII